WPLRAGFGHRSRHRQRHRPAHGVDGRVARAHCTGHGRIPGRSHAGASFIIVMEMVDGHAMVLTLMTADLGASLIARWLARPPYGALATAQRSRLGRSEHAAFAPPSETLN